MIKVFGKVRRPTGNMRQILYMEYLPHKGDWLLLFGREFLVLSVTQLASYEGSPYFETPPLLMLETDATIQDLRDVGWVSYENNELSPAGTPLYGADQ